MASVPEWNWRREIWLTHSKRVLADSGNCHDFSRNWPIAIDGIGNGNGRDGDNLDTHEAEPDDNDGRPRPFALQANTESLRMIS